jgi:hypothetical protein
VVNAFVEEFLRSLRRRAKRLFGLASVDRAFRAIRRFVSTCMYTRSRWTRSMCGRMIRWERRPRSPRGQLSLLVSFSTGGARQWATYQGGGNGDAGRGVSGAVANGSMF